MQNRPNTVPSSQRTSSRWYIAIFVLLVLAALTGLVQFHTLLLPHLSLEWSLSHPISPATQWSNRYVGFGNPLFIGHIIG